MNKEQQPTIETPAPTEQIELLSRRGSKIVITSSFQSPEELSSLCKTILEDPVIKQFLGESNGT